MGLDNFSRLFGDTETMKRNFTVIELKALIAASSQPLKGVKLKNELINIVSSICASGQHIKATASPKSLAALITDTMRKWPKDAITALYASEIFFTKFAQWMSTHPFKSEKIVQTEGRHVYNIPNWYSQLDSICGGLVTYILDPHHIFVNNRSRCCTYGMPCRVWESVTKAWHKVAQNEHDNETGLSMELVCEVRDRQRHYFAQLTFSEKVEEIMLKNGDCEESHWVKLIREFYRAADEAGNPTYQRIQWLLNMRTFLLCHYNACDFPHPDKFIRGLPYTQFEGMLTNIDARLQMYLATQRQTYNHRSLSSLDCETFFGSLQVNLVDYDLRIFYLTCHILL